MVQRAKSSEKEDVTTTEDTVEYTAKWSGDVAENAGECESHHRDRKKLSRRHCDDWQSRPEIAREPDYLKFLAEAEKEAVDPEQYLDMNDEDGCGRDQEAGTAPEFSDKVAAESSGNAASNLVIRFDSRSKRCMNLKSGGRMLTKVVRKTQECRRGARLGSQNLRVRISTLGC